jgi:hypothetical protein
LSFSIKKLPVAKIMEWDVVSDLASYKPKGFQLTDYPTTAPEILSTRQKQASYSHYQRSMLVPKCLKSRDLTKIAHAMLSLNALDISKKRSLESAIVYSQDRDYLPNIKEKIDIPTMSYNNFGKVGSFVNVGSKSYRCSAFAKTPACSDKKNDDLKS